MLRIQIILGSTRKGRISEKVGKWVEAQAKKLPEVEVELLDLRDYPLPFYNEAETPSTIKGKYSNAVAKKWVKKIGEADAYIVIAPEYNHGYPAVLKNALDYPYYEWNKKPIGFVSYGSVGGARSVEQLHLVSIELQMVPIRNTVSIQGVWTAFDEKNQPKDTKLNAFLQDFFGQLLWWAKALQEARKNTR